MIFARNQTNPDARALTGMNANSLTAILCADVAGYSCLMGEGESPLIGVHLR